MTKRLVVMQMARGSRRERCLMIQIHAIGRCRRARRTRRPSVRAWHSMQCQRLCGSSGDLLRKVSSASTVLPSPPIEKTARLFVHGLADAVAKEPCGFHAAMEHPLDLAGEMPFLLAHMRWMICSHRCSGKW